MPVKYEDYEDIFFLPPNVGVAVLVCLRSPIAFPRRENLANGII